MRFGSYLFTKLLFDEADETIFFIVATKRLVLCAFAYEFNCWDHLEILGCLLAVMGSLRDFFSYSVNISIHLGMLTQFTKKIYTF